MHNSIHYKYSAFLSVTKYLISGMCFILICLLYLFIFLVLMHFRMIREKLHALPLPPFLQHQDLVTGAAFLLGKTIAFDFGLTQ